MNDAMPKFKLTHPVGTQVRMKPEALADYIKERSSRAKDGRIGTVVSHTFPNEFPLVDFPQDGRKKPYAWGAINPQEWDIVSVPAAGDAPRLTA